MRMTLAPIGASSMLRRGAALGAVVLLLVLIITIAGCGGGGGQTLTTAGGGAAGVQSAGAGTQVVIKNFAFDPATVTIKAGRSVTWVNQDSSPHNVVGDKGEFDSKQMATGVSFTFKFDTPGTYAYHCSIHPSMTGTVVVQ